MALKIKYLRWYIAILLMLVTTVSYIDRTCLAVAGPTLKDKLHIDEKDFANVIICFQIAYLIMQPLGGRILDWLNLRKGLVLAVVWWSIANILHAFARTPLTLGLFRGLLGIGEGGNYPGVVKALAEWFPPRNRALATGVANMGSGTGAMIATPLVAWIILKYDWQTAFVVTGALGFIWVILWLIFYHPPEKHPWITPKELGDIRQGSDEIHVEDTPHQKGVWKLVLKQRNFWAIAVARFLAEPSWQFFVYWIPMYLTTQRQMNLKDLAIFAWIPFLAADLGSVIGGTLSTFYQKLGCGILTSRKAAVTTAAFIMPLALLIATAPSGGWAVIWFSVGAFAHNCGSVTLLTLPADLFPKRTVATAYGLTGAAAHLAGMLFTYLVGQMVTTWEMGYKPAFVIIAFLDIIAAGVIWLLLRHPTHSSNHSAA